MCGCVAQAFRPIERSFSRFAEAKPTFLPTDEPLRDDKSFDGLLCVLSEKYAILARRHTNDTVENMKMKASPPPMTGA